MTNGDCQITISSVVGFVPTGGAGPASIRVTGGAANCPSGSIRVTIACSAGSLQLVVPVTAQTWVADFTGIASTGCDCNKRINVRAECVDKETCAATFATVLHCLPPPPPPCQAVPSLSATIQGCAPS